MEKSDEFEYREKPEIVIRKHIIPKITNPELKEAFENIAEEVERVQECANECDIKGILTSYELIGRETQKVLSKVGLSNKWIDLKRQIMRLENIVQDTLKEKCKCNIKKRYW